MGVGRKEGTFMLFKPRAVDILLYFYPGLYCGLNKGKLAVLTYRNNDALYTWSSLLTTLFACHPI